MSEARTEAPDGAVEPIAGEPDGLPPVPGPIGRKLLLFEFLVLVEYWLAPLLFGVQNYAGLWSTVGWALFLLFVSSLFLFVVRPLRPHLSVAFGRPRARPVFYLSWVGSLVLGLFATNTFQLLSPGAAPLGWSWATVYTPFGPWTSLAFTLGPLDLAGTLNLEVGLVLGLLGFLWASSLVLGPLAPRPAVCERPAVGEGTGKGRLAAVAAWGPFGLISGCPSCAPAYVAWLSAIAPGPAASGYAAIPLVPWIGLAGLLYLASFGLVILALSRTTRPRSVADLDLPGAAE